MTHHITLNTMTRFKALLLSVACLASLACGGDSATTVSASLAGTWNMTSANGSSLPYVLQAANPKIEILNEQIIFSSAGTFTITGNARVTNAGTVSNTPITDAGTWTLTGNTVTAHFNSDNSNSSGVLSGNTLTVVETGFSAVFTKQ